MIAAAEAFGWGDGARLTQGPRGALGRIWRVDVDGHTYALKELFADPPAPERLAAELAFTGRATAAGVRLPQRRPAVDGRTIVSTVDGRWLCLYDWVDLRPLELTAATAHAVGTTLARLHRCAVGLDGDDPHPWYDTFPPVAAFAGAVASGAPWAARLAERLTDHAALTAHVTPVDPSRLLVCHRDLHPENILAGPDGAPVVVDWDNFGPADPARELVAVLFDWFGGPAPDLDAMRVLYRAYVDEGGPARITGPHDFAMLVAVRFNFLLLQTGIAMDAAATAEQRAWAEREVAETLDHLPTPGQVDAALNVVNPAEAPNDDPPIDP
ncbi:hypothetical protein Val02_36790 [Virgisporangium aliadipatigenens]|uniref:Aminoglycoside phosphotransferase domain-containing protein n=1 Tax=Virgisporangium aliadipatigenens TaxID=741659 RepID=A0A8J3YN88_9ACTN|nr:phosphotransferase [Virgisporangium aliadipatigenens]GIJ46793.1 hypothetical protein Val02_36790 [Virgisporangium aliadipatigenens]